MPRWATALKICHPARPGAPWDRSVAQRRDLRFALMEKRNPVAIRPRHIRLCPKVEQQVPPLRYPGFPVQLSGVGELHAAF
jgi:hypothetical protein